ncbi:hypothetical protein LINGRAHAP2_LOCUS27813 [Linum grandiflorum]
MEMGAKKYTFPNSRYVDSCPQHPSNVQIAVQHEGCGKLVLPLH